MGWRAKYTGIQIIEHAWERFARSVYEGERQF